MRYLVPGPPPCPEVVAVFYIRPAGVPTLFSVEGDAQVEQQNTVVGFLTAREGADPGLVSCLSHKVRAVYYHSLVAILTLK